MIGWTLAALALIAILNVRMGRSTILYPPLVFTSIWIAVLCFYATGVVDMFPLHDNTYMCVLFACISFSLGGAAAFTLPDWLFTAKIVEWSTDQSGSGRKILTTLLVLLFPLSLFLVYRSGTGTGSFSLGNVKASQLAALAGEDSEQTAFGSFYPLLALWSAFIVLIEKRDKLAVVCIVLAFVSAALSGGRTLLLQLVIGLACIYLIQNGKVSIRAGYRLILAAGTTFLGLASALVFVTKNMSEVHNDAAEALQFYILGYVVSGLGPLDYVLNHPVEYLHAPHHTFKFLLQAGKAVGLGTVPPPVMDEYLWIPFPTNVYTMLKPYITDFGFVGMLVAVFLLALLQTAVFRRALRGGKISLLITALIMYATVLCFFDDLYVQAKNFGLPILLAVFYFGVLNKVQLRKTRRGIRVVRSTRKLRFRFPSFCILRKQNYPAREKHVAGL